MPGKEDISFEIGKKYHLLTILEDLGTRRYGGAGKCVASFVLVQCECGTKFEVRLHALRAQKTISCGCILRHAYNKYGLKLKKHQQSRTKNHSRWLDMINRCYNKNTTSYKDYGGRGITVCLEWIQAYENFVRDMGEPPSSKHTLDRIDVNGNYCKENCRWATMKEQGRNKRTTHYVEYKNEKLSIVEWEEKLNFPRGIIYKRMSRGWDIEKIFSTRPLR